MSGQDGELGAARDRRRWRSRWRRAAAVRSATFFALGAFTAPLAAVAQVTEIEPNVRYDAGTRVGVAAMGASFVIPDGWLGTMPPGSEIFLLGSEVEAGLIAVLGNQVSGIEEAAASFAEELTLDPGVVLVPDGAPRVEGSTVRQTYRASAQGQVLFGQAYGRLGPTGIGVAFVAMGPESSAPRHRALLDELAASLELQAPAVSSPGASASSTDWDAVLRGRKLHYLYTASGFHEEVQIDLCADGTFYRSGGGGGFDGGTPGASGAWQHGGAGRWGVTGGVLRLESSDGKVASYQLSFDGEKLLLDGDRYFRVDPDRCP